MRGCTRTVAVAAIFALAVLGLPAAAFANAMTISASPTSGPPGTAVTVTGAGWTHAIYDSGVPIDIGVNYGNGQWVSLAHRVANPEPDADGNFTVVVRIPANAPFGQLLGISALTGSGGSADADFAVTAQAPGGAPPPPGGGPLPPQPSGPDLGKAVDEAVGYCLDGIVKEGKDEALKRMAKILFGEDAVEIADIVHTATGAYEISYKAQNGTLTKHDVWEAGRIAVKLADQALDKASQLIPKEFRPIAAAPARALWLTLKVGPAWLYCMEAATYVTEAAANWVAGYLRPLVGILVNTRAVELRTGLVGWLRSLDPSGPPAMPTGLTATPAGPRAIQVRWDDNSGNETAFVVFNGNEDRRVAKDQTTYLWAVTPGAYMCVNVRATNEYGESAQFPDHEPWYVCTTTPLR